jgi:hypothetical protein
VEILAMELTTDVPKVYDNCREIVGGSMTKMAADQVFKKTGLTRKDIGVV